jgi:hypothetical protein
LNCAVPQINDVVKLASVSSFWQPRRNALRKAESYV